MNGTDFTHFIQSSIDNHSHESTHLLKSLLLFNLHKRQNALLYTGDSPLCRLNTPEDITAQLQHEAILTPAEAEKINLCVTTFKNIETAATQSFLEALASILE